MTQEIIKIESEEPKKNKGGRPPIYDNVEQMQLLIDEYFEIKLKNKRMVVLKDETIVYIPDPEPVHIAGLCAYLRLTDETLRQYEQKEEFSGSIKEAKQMCQAYSVDMCFKGKNKADFVLMNNFGWRNRSEQENKGSNFIGLTAVVTEEELANARKKIENADNE